MSEVLVMMSDSRHRRWILAAIVPFVVQGGLILLDTSFLGAPLDNVLSDFAVLVSAVAGFAFLISEHRRVLLALLYLPLMIALLIYYSLALDHWVLGGP